MPAATQTQIHHALVQDLLTGTNPNPVVVELAKRGLFKMEGAENLISLPNDIGLAGKTGVTRHASSHAALRDAQNVLLDNAGDGDFPGYANRLAAATDVPRVYPEWEGEPDRYDWGYGHGLPETKA